MITVRIPKEIDCVHLLSTIRYLEESGVQSFEFNVRSLNTHKLIICTNLGLIQDKACHKNHIQLEELFEWIKRENLNIQIILNLQEPNLEGLIKRKVDKGDLKKQVKYTGNVIPTYLTPWDRPYIYYNVENCLPNFYELGTIKKAHFDVIHYFCRKMKVKTLRIKFEKVTAELLYWAKAHDLKLSVCDVDTFEEAEELHAQGVDYVTTTDIDLLENERFKEM